MEQSKQKFRSIFTKNNNSDTLNANFSENAAKNLFFAPFDNPMITNAIELESKKTEKQKFINDVDSSLLMENVNRTAQNKVVKIKLKLNTLEKNLARIEDELKVLQLFNLDKDIKRREELLKLKNNITLQIENLKADKDKYGLIYILSAYTDNKISLEFLQRLCRIISYYSKKYYFKVYVYLKHNKYFNKFFKLLR